MAGTVLAGAALVAVGLAWLVHPRWGAGLAATMAAELVTGREAAIPLALSQGVPPGWIAVTSILQNLAVAALVVPVAMAALALPRQPKGRTGKWLALMSQEAERQAGRGGSALAIFLFMLVPFLANGPVIAGLIGCLAGIERRRLAVAVVAAVVVTAVAWSLAYGALAAALAGIDPRLARLPAVAAGLAVVWGLGRMIWRWCTLEADPEAIPSPAE